MRTRNIVIGMVLLVTGVTAGIFIGYSQSKGEDALDADNGGTAVIVARVDIPANQRLDDLLEEPKKTFKEVLIPVELLVGGTITDLEQLRGMTTTTPIIANEQVSSYRIGIEEGPV